ANISSSCCFRVLFAMTIRFPIGIPRLLIISGTGFSWTWQPAQPACRDCLSQPRIPAGYTLSIRPARLSPCRSRTGTGGRAILQLARARAENSLSPFAILFALVTGCQGSPLAAARGHHESALHVRDREGSQQGPGAAIRRHFLRNIGAGAVVGIGEPCR